MIDPVEPGDYLFTLGPRRRGGHRCARSTSSCARRCRRLRRPRPAGRFLADGDRLHRAGAGAAARRQAGRRIRTRSRHRRAGAGAAVNGLSADGMNYRHAYHAGNFADVVKHVVLTRLVEYLKQKDKAFRVIDTHAGIGRYDLSSEEAQKTGEWRGGIGRLIEAKLAPEAAGAARALSRSGAGGQCRWRGRKISGLAADRAASPAQAGPAVGDRTASAGCRRLKSAVCRRFPDPGHRARRLAGARRASAAEGKARPRAGRSAVRGRRRVRSPRRRAANGAPALAGRHLCAVVSDQGPGGCGERSGPALRETGIPKILDIVFEIRAPSPRSPPRRQRHGGRQPALHARKRNAHRAAGACKAVLAERPGADWTLEWLAGENARRLTATALFRKLVRPDRMRLP